MKYRLLPLLWMGALLGCGEMSPPPSDRLLSEVRLGNIYDAAYLIDRSAFTEKHLVSLANSALSKEGGKFSLIRVTLASSPRWLEITRPTLMHGYQNPEGYNQEVRASQIAQLVSRDGIGVLRMKFGGHVVTKQITGAGDPRTLKLGQVIAIFEGFTLSSLGVKEVDFYLTVAGALPSSSQRAGMYAELKRLAGVERVGAVIRPDDQFIEVGGWDFDVFQLLYPDVPVAEHDKRVYLGCGAKLGNGGQRPDTFECLPHTTAEFRGLPL